MLGVAHKILSRRFVSRAPLNFMQFSPKRFNSQTPSMGDHKVLIAISDGSEDMETVIAIDILRRANFDVTVASVTDKKTCVMAKKTKIEADHLLSECKNHKYDLIVLPGGMPGAEHLRDSHLLKEICTKQHEEKRWIGAICATPAVALASWKLLPKKATCYPGFNDKFPHGTTFSEERVVIAHEEKVVTSRGPGTATEFALKLIEVLSSREKMESVANPLLAHLPPHF